MRHLLTCLLVFLLPARANANTETGAFAIRSGSVPAAVFGEGVGAIEGHADAALWNPAAIIDVTRPELTASYHDVFGLGLARYGDVAFAWRPSRDDVTVSEGKIRMSSGFGGPAFVFTASALTVDLGEERYTEVSPGAGIALPLGTGGAFGAVARLLRASAGLDGVSATGYAVDLGIVQPVGPFVRLALSARNLLGRLSWKEGDEETMPSEWAGALSVRPHRRVQLVLGGAADLSDDLVDRANVGARVEAWREWWWLLVGYDSRRSGDDRNGRATFGTELAHEQVRVGYAFLPEDDSPGDTHRLSMSVTF